MSKAFRCDRCGKVFDGIADMQAALNKSLEMLRCFMLGVKFTPESDEAPLHFKDFCPACAKELCEWLKGGD